MEKRHIAKQALAYKLMDEILNDENQTKFW